MVNAQQVVYALVERLPRWGAPRVGALGEQPLIRGRIVLDQVREVGARLQQMVSTRPAPLSSDRENGRGRVTRRWPAEWQLRGRRIEIILCTAGSSQASLLPHSAVRRSTLKQGVSRSAICY